MRSRVSVFALLLVAGSLALPFAAHASIPFFGPIIPPEAGQQICPLGWGALINIINRIIELLITLAIVFVAPLMIAWSGFLFVVNPVDPSGISRAKEILTNTVVGIIIALAGWLIVDAIMAVLYNKDNPDLAGKTWSQLITGNSNDPCLTVVGSLKQSVPPAPVPGVAVVVPSGAITTVGMNGQQAPLPAQPTVSNTSLQAGYAAASAYSAQIASACAQSSIPNCSTVVTALIAQESGGKPATGCNSAGACGIMQLTKANGGTSCAAMDTACIGTQVSRGVQLLEQGYNKFPNVTNTLAAYNSGITTQSGQSANGRNSAMVASVNCPGLYAWQCATNPGGLVETQQYVANICQDIILHGGGCN